MTWNIHRALFDEALGAKRPLSCQMTNFHIDTRRGFFPPSKSSNDEIQRNPEKYFKEKGFFPCVFMDVCVCVCVRVPMTHAPKFKEELERIPKRIHKRHPTPSPIHPVFQ